jgi:hypothetical protein
MQSETKLETVLKQWGKLTSMRFKSHVCKSWKEDGIYRLTTIEIAKHKRKITKSILKRCKNIKIGSMFSSYGKHIVLYKIENQSSQHLYKQGNQLVSLLPNPSHSCLKVAMRSNP